MAADPISSTGAATALTGVTFFGILSGLDYGVVFGAFAGAVYYVATAADLTTPRRVAYFLVSYIAGVLCAGLVGSKLAVVTGYSDKPLDALGAVIISALAIKILTFINNQDLAGVFSRFRGGTNGNK
ncbi:phage holin family protein [Buttiauxella gaviniae]|uniref:Putative prophage membrane protein n=1 Tax=Buttiauxella gaviniae ATCC 51604 TaxID=1354253 RepID=A0A1B7HP33_9ENTR|nr:phage holin family protein [Buttiauxella gaviniae]OAT17401.1 putative prophage membrane protein [Buttiauxella gaviniae ATCC 51604]